MGSQDVGLNSPDDELNSPVEKSPAEKEDDGDGKHSEANSKASLPWDGEPEKPEDRVVGWRSGTSLKKADIKSIIMNDREARHNFRAVRNQMYPKKKKEGHQPMQGLPPEWQAFWGAVPHLDAQAAFKAASRHKNEGDSRLVRLFGGQQEGILFGHQGKNEGEKDEKDEKAEPGEELDPAVEAAAEADIVSLQAKLAQKQQEMAQLESQGANWDKKVERARKQDSEEAAKSLKVQKVLSTASYEFGKVQGMVRSSSAYHAFCLEDNNLQSKRKVANLSKTYALLKAQITDTKDEIRSLLHEVKSNKHSGGVASGGEHNTSADAASASRTRSRTPPPSPQRDSMEAEALRKQQEDNAGDARPEQPPPS